MADIQACTDHGCIYGHPGGMGTNGGCKCLYELPLDKRRRAEQNIRALRAQLETVKSDLSTCRMFKDEWMRRAKDREATIARQRAWIEAAGHRPGCAANHCAACMWDASYHSSGAMREPHAFQPGPCNCGWAELVGG